MDISRNQINTMDIYIYIIFFTAYINRIIGYSLAMKSVFILSDRKVKRREAF